MNACFLVLGACLVTPLIAQPLPKVIDVRESASLGSQPFAFFSIATIFGEDLADFEVILPFQGPLPLNHRDIEVVVDFPVGDAAPRLRAGLLFISPRQINIHLPYSGRGPLEQNPVVRRVTLRVIRNGVSSLPISLTLTNGGNSALGIFSSSGGGSGQVVALQGSTPQMFDPRTQDFVQEQLVVNSRLHPARPGDWVSVYLNGLFPGGGESPAEGGAAGGFIFGQPTDVINIVVGGLSIPVQWIARMAPIHALHFLLFQLPEGIPPGCQVPLRAEFAGRRVVSQDLTIAVARAGETCDGMPLPNPD